MHLLRIIVVSAALLPLFVKAQQFEIKGTVADSLTGESIPGVTVSLSGTSSGVVSDASGHFSLKNQSDTVTLIFSHISYVVNQVTVFPADTSIVDIGVVKLQARAVELETVKVIASFITDRKTPVAFATVRARTIEQKIGNQDYPEILKMTPGIYATKEGGGSGDDRLTLRGFQQENVALLLNGVPVSSMENGLVYWSNWAGLTDATEAIQVQRGLGASRLAMNSVGGTINIITRSVSAVSGGTIRYSLSDYGNRKTILSFSTGKMKNGISLTFLGSRTNGQGYVDATYVDGWAYFLSMSKSFGSKHRLIFTAMGSPEKHGQRNYGMSVAEYEKYGIKYNKNWGEYNGNLLSLSENFYHKPQINLNHYWDIKKGTQLSTSAYLSIGSGGGRYTEAFNYGRPTWDFRKNNQLDFDEVFLSNAAHTDSFQLVNGSYVKDYSKNILTNYKANHYWIGFLSTLSHEVSQNLKIITGFHVRKFRSHLYEEIDDLMGGDFWIEQYAWSLAGVNGRKQIMMPGDIINVNNFSSISYGNLFGQAEYKFGRLTAFAASTLSGTQYQREDPYNYPEAPLSERVTKGGFDVKTGISYKAGKYSNFYANAGFYSREPYYKFVYVNFSNTVAHDLVNEKINSAEVGYTFENEIIITRLNLYHTFWRDKSLLSRENIQLADSSLTRSLVRGLNAVHQGVEGDISVKISNDFTISATVSLGNWKWQNDVTASIYNDNQVLVDSMQVYTKGLYVGDAPQTQIGFSAEYHSVSGFRLGADWLYYNRLYANFDPVNRNLPEDRKQPYRIPDYSLFDLYSGYDFALRNFPVSLQLNCQNVFDKETIIRGDDGATHDLDSFRGFWSLGRTFNFSAKITF